MIKNKLQIIMTIVWICVISIFMAIAVYALTTTKELKFFAGIKYNPTIIVDVYINNNLVFSSRAPGEVNQDYVDNIVNDTINFNSNIIAGETYNIRIVNCDTQKDILYTINNNGELSGVIEKNNGTNSNEATETITITETGLGQTLFSIKLEILYDLKYLVSNDSTGIDFGEVGKIETNSISGTTFYVSNVDGLLNLSALVGGINTTTTEYDPNYVYGYDNSAGPAVTFKGATIQMLNDIDCKNGDNKDDFEKTFIPIGNSATNSFQGTFDGNNKTITGLYINQTTNGVGLFGYALNAEIKDLKMINCKINSQNEAVGCFVGTTRDVNIFNCGTEESEVNGLNRIGGLIGDYSIRDKNTIISNCYNIGSLTGLGASIGGIVGSVTCYDNTTLTISNCYNTGSVTGSYNSAAGILGEVQCYDDTILTITNCYNTGNIGSYGGGIIGYVCNGQRSLTQIYDCYNFGNVCSGILDAIDGYGIIKIYNCYNKGNVIYSGIVGDNYGSQNLGELIVNKCFNIAEIIESGGVGGLSGGIIGNNSGKVTIADCYNTGDITSNNDCIGGVVGNNKGIIVITNCYNTGSVSGSSNIGGILGNADSTSNTIITNCYNTGSVSGTSKIGGILGGGVDIVEVIITTCYNIGNVTGTSDNIGGILGHGNNFYSTITNSYSTGSVSGSSNIGGIVGRGVKTITNSYNTGSVSGSSNIGGIVGDVDITATITNCYYLESSSSKAIGIGNATAGSYYGTFSSAESELAECDDSPSELAYGTTNLLTVLNAYVSKHSTYTDETSGLEIKLTTWEIRAGENDGYPVFVITETVA